MSMSKDLIAKLDLINAPILLPKEKESVDVVVPSIRNMFSVSELDACNLGVTVNENTNSYTHSQDVIFFDKSSGDVMLAVEVRGARDKFSNNYGNEDYKPTNPDLVKATIVEALAHCHGGPEINKERLTMYARLFGAMLAEKFAVQQASLDLGYRANIKASFVNSGVTVALTCILNSPRSPLLVPLPTKFGVIMRRWEHNNWDVSDWNGGRLERVVDGKAESILSIYDDRHRNTTKEALAYRFPEGQVKDAIRSFASAIYKDVELVNWCVEYIEKWCQIKGGAEIYAMKHEPYHGDTKKISLELHAVTTEGETFRINL